MAVNEGLAGLVPSSAAVAVEQVKTILASNDFSEGRRGAYNHSWEFRHRSRCSAGVLVVQTVVARIFQENEIRMLTEAAAQLARW